MPADQAANDTRAKPEHISLVLASLDSNLPAQTAKALSGDLRAWGRWCVSSSRAETLPASPREFAAWLLAMADQGAAQATIRRRACSLVRLHRIRGFANPRKLPDRTFARHGRARQARDTPRLAISHVRAAAPGLDGRDLARLVVGLALGLGPARLLGLQHQHVNPDTLTISIGGVATSLALAGSPLAPADAIARLHDPTQPEARLIGLSQRGLGRLVKRAAKLAGEQPGKFSGVSLRRGARST